MSSLESESGLEPPEPSLELQDSRELISPSSWVEGEAEVVGGLIPANSLMLLDPPLKMREVRGGSGMQGSKSWC